MRQHAIPHIVERFVNKIEDPIKIMTQHQQRAFCYIDDAVKGTVRAMERRITQITSIT